MILNLKRAHLSLRRSFMGAFNGLFAQIYCDIKVRPYKGFFSLRKDIPGQFAWHQKEFSLSSNDLLASYCEIKIGHWKGSLFFLRMSFISTDLRTLPFLSTAITNIFIERGASLYLLLNIKFHAIKITISMILYRSR